MAGVQGGSGRVFRRRPRRWAAGLALAVACFAAWAPSAARAQAVTEFQVPTPNSLPAGITVGPDGAIWFTEENGHKIGRLGMDGAFTEYPTATQPSTPTEITAGRDGALWFTQFGAGQLAHRPDHVAGVARITVDGTCCREWEIPLGSGADGITTGPDGAIWFTSNGTAQVGRITQFADPSIPPELFDVSTVGFRPGDITTGPDGRLWFTMSEAHKIGAITTGGSPTSYQLAFGADPSGIASSGGALWFTQHGFDSIGRIPTFGLPVTEFGPTGTGPSGIALGPDGALWFTEKEVGKIGRMTTTGRITEFALPDPRSQPGGIVAGPDGAMWFTEEAANKIGRIEAVAAAGSSSSPSTYYVPPALSTSKSGSKTSAKARKRACRVPRLRGLPVRKARKKLRRARCRYRLRGRGRVVFTRPQAGIRTRSRVQVRARPRPG